MNLSLKNAFYKLIFKARAKALSLIEVSIALVIIGLLIFGALRGWKWVESARLNNTVQQVLQIQTAHESYKQVHHQSPRPEDFWKALLSFGGPKSEDGQVVKSSIGATFISEKGSILLAPLSAQQALQIKSTLDQNDELNVGWLKVIDSSRVVIRSVDLQSTEKDYGLLIELT